MTSKAHVQINDRVSVTIDTAENPPKTECYALMLGPTSIPKLGRFTPGEVPCFASDAAAPIDAFFHKHKFRRPRPVNFERSDVYPVVEMARRLR